ncbi:hypothetical protein [Propioniciclava soli]|uniref:Uncharacterized protein n=1 Tax=Propioniciclava soli TaxID=2775081 RepID=A0ABZ3C891_9ACTN|nr:hypothetical protein [Propioniciclava soli]
MAEIVTSVDWPATTSYPVGAAGRGPTSAGPAGSEPLSAVRTRTGVVVRVPSARVDR